MNGELPGWEADVLGSLAVTITIGGKELRLATVTYDGEVPPCVRTKDRKLSGLLSFSHRQEAVQVFDVEGFSLCPARPSPPSEMLL